MELSVIICTHNPRPPYLRRVLDALQAQTLPREGWELVLVDNASPETLAKTWDLSWHPHARHVREEKLGAVHARARGIREAVGDVLLFVDDDNVLAPDYLATALAIMRERPDLGAIGAGVIEGEFEVPPPKSIEPYLGGLAVGSEKQDLWTNFGDFTSGVPVGAGMAFRREVGHDFLGKMESHPVRKLMGRVGPEVNLGSGEDIDIALCAHDLGLGTGRFMALKIAHLMPKQRLTEEYMERLYVGFARSKETLHFIRRGTLCDQSVTPIRQLRYLYSVCTLRGFERRMFVAQEKARQEVRRELAKFMAAK